jgi:hypothetical protein
MHEINKCFTCLYGRSEITRNEKQIILLNMNIIITVFAQEITNF